MPHAVAVPLAETDDEVEAALPLQHLRHGLALRTVVLVLRDDLLAIKADGGGWAIELEAILFFSALVLAIMGGGGHAIARGRWD